NEKISVFRKSIFVYPKSTLIKDKNELK
ncbi:hypothetical protein ACE616_001783, partial [Campylobacter jejuni]